MGIYPMEPYEKGAATAVLKSHRARDKPVDVRRMLPGNVILVHGVNDVGTCYHAIEAGLCDGLRERLKRTFQAASYRQPGAADKNTVLDDPDAVFYKRDLDVDVDSPVIPFYWGYRERDGMSRTVRGQKTDRYGNRLDKDFSKGGGPFANATSTLPDMWNKGFGLHGNWSDDPIRPLFDAPGRMYMVLAAARLMALIAMIRDYDDKETVTVIAHSQGCLLTLLAQAMLAEKGLRPADTLILTHPPYSLVDQADYWVTKQAARLHGGSDAAMEPFYDAIAGTQSLHGRLQTLVNIVARVADPKRAPAEPQFATLSDHKMHDGVVGGLWKAEADRDNRGKVYLYFCPQDMTVALDNMQGIGWQGVPEFIEGTQVTMVPEMTTYRGHGHPFPTGRMVPKRERQMCPALDVLGKGFYQRVFSNKLRPDPATGKSSPVLVGQAPPYDYVLRLKGEDDQGHVEASGRKLRIHFPEASLPPNPFLNPAAQRNGIRKITGEALRVPVTPVLSNAVETAPANIPAGSPHALPKREERGPCEDVDPIDAEIAVTSDGGVRRWYEVRPDPRLRPGETPTASRFGVEPTTPDDLARMTEAYNKEKNRTGEDRRTIVEAYYRGEVFHAKVEESPHEARLRWQHELSAKSFHGAIVGNSENHRQVTAYDVAIGQGKAATDPKFYNYLCAVADWRLKKPSAMDPLRPGILMWETFTHENSAFWKNESAWRKELIEGNANYYSTGQLPKSLPLLTGNLWEIVISDTVSGDQVHATPGARQ